MLPVDVPIHFKSVSSKSQIWNIRVRIDNNYGLFLYLSLRSGYEELTQSWFMTDRVNMTVILI